MSSNEIDIPAATAQPERLGQATAVEQSRAVAEVQGAILVAQRCPRNVNAAVSEMESSCNQKGLADRAFYAVPRAGGTVNGATVHLARELARVWGNVQYGVSEMRRDDMHGQSEMKAFAWDVQTNTRVETTFVVPHIRDTKSGAKKLTSMDDIYMSNANAGARRVRECIFSILPPWFVEQAKENCQKTLEHGGGVPLPKRISVMIKTFEELDVSVDQLEQRVGKPNTKWTARDLAQLTTIGGSLRRGEIERDEAFPPQRLSADDLGAAPDPAEKPKTTRRTSRAKATDDTLTAEQSNEIRILLAACGILDADQAAVVSRLAGERIPDITVLSSGAVDEVLATLHRCADNDNPADALDAVLAEIGGE